MYGEDTTWQQTDLNNIYLNLQINLSLFLPEENKVYVSSS